MRDSTLARFFAFVDQNGPIAKNNPELGRCWIWTGGTTRGYGIFWANGKSHRAHVWSYKTFVRDLPAGKQLDHFACDRTGCVNYRHVRPVPSRENVLRSANPAAENRGKDECPGGHLFAEYGHVNAQGSRECVVCKRDQQRIIKQAKRAIERGYIPLPAGTAICPAGHDVTGKDGHKRRDGTVVCMPCNPPLGKGGRPPRVPVRSASQETPDWLPHKAV